MNVSDWIQESTVLVRNRTRLVLQTEAAECGLACLTMISSRYGYRVDLPALRHRYNISTRGTTLHDLVHMARGLKFATRAVRAELSGLRRLRLPCILHW